MPIITVGFVSSCLSPAGQGAQCTAVVVTVLACCTRSTVAPSFAPVAAIAIEEDEVLLASKFSREVDPYW